MGKAKFNIGDKVRILDKHGHGNWNSRMSEYVGKVMTITKNDGCWRDEPGYRMKEDNGKWFWNEQFVEQVKLETIVIYRDGQEVIALDKRTGKKAVAKCCPSDEFKFETGARIAFDRLLTPAPKFKVGDKVIGNERADKRYSITKTGWRGKVVDVAEYSIKVKSNTTVSFWVDPEYFDLDTTPTYYNGKVVCIKSTEKTSFTVGKIYEVTDGTVRDNDGDIRPTVGSGIESLKDLNRRYGEFIEVVE